MAQEREEILARIDELETLLEQIGDEIEFQSGDMVNYSADGRSGVAMVESIRDDQVTIRVMAVAGDNYEATDDVLTLASADISPMETDGSEPQEEPDPENEPEESEDEQGEDEEDEEELEKGVFVQWQSKYGDTVGRIVEVSAEDIIIPETGEEIPATGKMALIEVYQDKDGWEDTGVHVAIPAKSLEVIDELDVKAKKLMVKVKNMDVEEDEKVGWLKGIGSAYGKVDLGGDTVAKGAYTQTIKHNDGKVQLSVDHGFKVADVVGVAYLKDSEEGLLTESKMPLHIPHVKQAYEMAKFMLSEGKPLGYSIEYFPVKTEPLPNGVRELKEIALEGMTITPWPMDTHARIRDAKSRKITYHTKRRGWQAVVQRKTDAPTGNRDQEGDYKSLSGLLTEIKHNLEEYHGST